MIYPYTSNPVLNQVREHSEGPGPAGAVEDAVVAGQGQVGETCKHIGNRPRLNAAAAGDWTGHGAAEPGREYKGSLNQAKRYHRRSDVSRRKSFSGARHQNEIAGPPRVW